MRSPKLVAATMVACALLISSAAGAASPVADVSLGTMQVEWQPTGEFAGMSLRVSGPLGVVERDFAAGENPQFDLRSMESVADGLYTWEVVAAPRLDEGVRRAMAEARAAGDGAVEGRLRASGALPNAADMVQSGSFRVVGGAIQQPTGEAERGPGLRQVTSDVRRVTAEDQVIPDDLIVQGSICAGLDCVNNENFGFDTIRMKENNTRIDFTDTSSTAGFPSQDWEIAANDSASGGRNALIVSDENTQLFVIESGINANALYVDDIGRIGLRTSNPVLDLHISTSNTPAIRLEQTNAGGFTAQTWDIAGNEANFFVRDVTGGSLLPFRIRPGAPTSSVDISADGDVGIGTASPADKLHIASTADPTNGQLFIENTSGTSSLRTMINMQNNGGIRWQMGTNFQVRFNNNQFQFDNTTNAGNECIIDQVGNLTCLGVKNFATIDPVDDSRAIYYAALEGPEAGTYFRGRGTMVDGEAVIELPEHFTKVTEVEGMTVHLTPIGAWAQLYVAESTPERLVVRQAGSEEMEDVSFSFLVQGVRMGYSEYEVMRSSANLIGER